MHSGPSLDTSLAFGVSVGPVWAARAARAVRTSPRTALFRRARRIHLPVQPRSFPPSTRPPFSTRLGAARLHCAWQAPAVQAEWVGREQTHQFRIYFRTADENRGGMNDAEDAAGRISPWHDIALFADESQLLLNYVNEIPKGTTAKMEIATGEKWNPLKQDIKNGQLRHYAYGPSLVNYGALPQTWEDPAVLNPDTQCGGDNDPVDVIEIGSETLPMGAVVSVKPIGMLALIDGGETDWKLLAIRADDPRAKAMRSVADMERHFPGLLHQVRDWFRLYKTAEGKAENTYGFHGEALDVQMAMRIVRETHESWRRLKSGERRNEEALALE